MIKMMAVIAIKIMERIMIRDNGNYDGKIIMTIITIR